MIRASYGIVWAIASIGGQPGDCAHLLDDRGRDERSGGQEVRDGLAASAGRDQLVEV